MATDLGIFYDEKTRDNFYKRDWPRIEHDTMEKQRLIETHPGLAFEAFSKKLDITGLNLMATSALVPYNIQEKCVKILDGLRRKQRVHHPLEPIVEIPFSDLSSEEFESLSPA